MTEVWFKINIAIFVTYIADKRPNPPTVLKNWEEKKKGKRSEYSPKINKWALKFWKSIKFIEEMQIEATLRSSISTF